MAVHNRPACIVNTTATRKVFLTRTLTSQHNATQRVTCVTHTKSKGGRLFALSQVALPSERLCTILASAPTERALPTEM